MRGYMRQRGNSWELRVFLGEDAATGRKHYATKTVKGGKREAQRALAAMVTQAAEGRLSASRATVGSLLEEWFAQAGPEFSPKTAKETRGVLDRHLIPAFGTTPLRRLRARDIDTLYAQLRAGKATAHRPLSPATIRRVHGVLHVALAQGVRWGWIPLNPASAASPPRVHAADITPPSPSELGHLFSTALSTVPDFAVFVAVAAATGARRSEVIALRWTDLDLERGRVTIARGIVIGPDGPVEKDTKTHAARTVSLDATTVAMLTDHHEQMMGRAAEFRLLPDDSAFVFSDAADLSEPWRPDSTTRRFVQLRDRCGLSHVRLHDLRHYVATTMLTAGVDVRTVAGRLGHRSAMTTLNVYSHFIESADRDAADRLGKIFDAALQPPDAPT
jgi:integrase